MPRPRKKPFRKRRVFTRVNERIKSPRVRVILSTTNEQLGVMDTREAVQKAKSLGLDLVEIAAKADPPVCRIVDYGKYKYEEAKKKKERPKSPSGKLKEVKFRVRTDPHDYQIKLARGESFLENGSKLRVQLQFRGREAIHPELGFEVLNKVAEDLSGMGVVDMKPRQAGRAISMTLTPLPAHSRERRFFTPKEEMMRQEAEDAAEDWDEEPHEDDEASGNEDSDSDKEGGEGDEGAEAEKASDSSE